ncbi:hypothetical protein ABPG75_009746 [Micractinium tetrahymenae]
MPGLVLVNSFSMLQQAQSAASCSGRSAPGLACRPFGLARQGRPLRAPRGLIRVRAEEDERVRGLLEPPPEGEISSTVSTWLNPPKEELPDDFEMPIWDHLDELRERVLVGALAAAVAVLTCFVFSKDLVVFLEAPVAAQGVRFLQLSPGEFFFTTLKVGGYAGLLLSVPTILYEIAAYVVPGLTKAERQFLVPVILGSSVLFYAGLLFSYEILTPAALNFFVNYADGAVESLWSIDQYFEFVLVLMLSTGLSFQVPVIQVMLGQLGLVSSEMMFSQWRYVVVGATVAAAVLTPSTDPFTQTLLAVPLVGLYMGGAYAVKVLEARRAAQQA